MVAIAYRLYISGAVDGGDSLHSFLPLLHSHLVLRELRDCKFARTDQAKFIQIMLECIPQSSRKSQRTRVSWASPSFLGRRGCSTRLVFER